MSINYLATGSTNAVTGSSIFTAGGIDVRTFYFQGY